MSFSYDARQEVLHDINLISRQAKSWRWSVRAVRAKSTIFNLIPRFPYDPDFGQRMDAGH
ncbi:MAG: hypothetical protein U0521_29870 [Anaerolineae bacterium]